MIASDIQLLEEATTDYSEALIEEAHAEAAYKKSWSRVFLSVSGARHVKEAAADDQCCDENERRLLACARSKALREHMWTIRARLDSLRSLNANVREQV
jgi:hypothetical protein